MNFEVKVHYQPKFVESNNISKFKMICESGNKEDFSCKGFSRQLDISFNTNSINFGEVKL